MPSDALYLQSEDLNKTVHQSAGEFKELEEERGGGGGGGGRIEAGVGDAAMANAESQILVVSSVGRSGSTFMGELLSQQPSSVYFFEPELYVYRHLKEEVTQENSLPVIMDMLNCKFRDDFVDWLKSRNMYNVYRTNLTENCEKMEYCIRHDLLTGDCQTKSVKVIKVIKMRLQWVRPLLKNPSLNLKVIHLIRDPRASLASLARRGMPGKDPQESCPRILMDIRAVPALQKQFPGKVFSVKYENFFTDPEETALDLWKFIRGSDSTSALDPASGNPIELPLSWKTFLETHTSVNKGNVFNTFRNSKLEVMAWRQEIDEIFLLEVEKHCIKVIRALGHIKFGSIENAANMNIPLFRAASKVRPLFFSEHNKP
ncbi:carbohydrate sulfotransferase 5-like [Oratosquilla oratoria]|uniref:carbohydrate sulfotransferase 5-like n=1 Tax=Oratosquilla oratoria TaxID=337810 RepID=UPI003F777352